MVRVDLLFEGLELLQMFFGGLDGALGHEGWFLELGFVFGFGVAFVG